MVRWLVILLCLGLSVLVFKVYVLGNFLDVGKLDGWLFWNVEWKGSWRENSNSIEKEEVVKFV